MDEEERKDFEFAEHQLGVIDTKANNVLMVDSVLIVISTLSMLFESNINPTVKTVSTVATICVLVSVSLCIRTIWTKWATELDFAGVIKVRNIKTWFLHHSLRMLFVALALYVAMFVVDLLIRIGIMK